MDQNGPNGSKGIKMDQNRSKNLWAIWPQGSFGWPNKDLSLCYVDAYLSNTLHRIIVN